MRLPARVGNAPLATLLAGSGIASQEQFAHLVNQHGAHAHGLHLSYDRNSVARWVKGGDCQHPQVVAEVLSQAWGIPIPAVTIWPSTHGGTGPVAVHLHPWVATHTVTQMSLLVRRDVLTDPTAAPPAAVDARALVGTIRRWLAAEPGRLGSRPHGATEVTPDVVEDFGGLTRDLAGTAARVGGRWVRDAAVGHLRSGVDLLHHSRYTTATGNQLLAEVADLAGTVATWCADADRPELAHAYATLGLHAGHETTHPTGPAVVAAILSLLADQHGSGHGDTGRVLLELATGHLAPSAEHRAVRAVLAARRAAHLATQCPDRSSEVVNAIDLALALTEPEDASAWIPVSLNAAPGATVHHTTANAYLTLAQSAAIDTVEGLASHAEAAACAAIDSYDPRRHRQARAAAQRLLAETRTLSGHAGTPAHA